MLEAIADFWKPSRKGGGSVRIEPNELQVGSQIGFGFVPQGNLSGRRLRVESINTYQFGNEALTSFVLAQDKDAGASMIVAESEGEQYLAISRRISISDRIKLFDSHDLEGVVSQTDVTRLSCNNDVPEIKGWVVSSYKREIQGMHGRLFKGDFRAAPLPAASVGQDFQYTLLVSDSNEHAIEIEKYGDGRMEVYATVYRRLSDVGEITHPATNNNQRPETRITVSPQLPQPQPQQAQPQPPRQENPVAAPLPAKPPEAPRPQPVKLQDFSRASAPAAPPLPKPDLFTTVKDKPATTTTQPTSTNGTQHMNTTDTNARPKLYVQPTAPETNREVKAMTNGSTNFDADAIECELRVANRIIDEAIRNEMRLTDIVRRIIELPVANQESVQIPVTLTDEDYSLLAIRYGISSSDRNSIKRRIIEDLNNFSGEGVAKKAA